MRIQLDLDESYLDVLEYYANADYRSRKEFMEVLLMKFVRENSVSETDMEKFKNNKTAAGMEGKQKEKPSKKAAKKK